MAPYFVRFELCSPSQVLSAHCPAGLRCFQHTVVQLCSSGKTKHAAQRPSRTRVGEHWIRRLTHCDPGQVHDLRLIRLKTKNNEETEYSYNYVLCDKLLHVYYIGTVCVLRVCSLPSHTHPESSLMNTSVLYNTLSSAAICVSGSVVSLGCCLQRGV